jgi:hypothetical protein
MGVSCKRCATVQPAMVIGVGPAGFVNKTKSQRCDGWLDGGLSGSFWTLKNCYKDVGVTLSII